MPLATAAPEPSRRPVRVRLVCWPLPITGMRHAEMLVRWRAAAGKVTGQ